MDSKHWVDVRKLFEASLELPEDKRAEFLEESDATREVKALAHTLLRSSQQDLSGFQPPTPPPSGSPASPILDLDAGVQVGAYVVARHIGSGGMADVYEASQDRPARKVALKILRGDLSDKATARFEFEAEILGRLRHPAIAQVYDLGETQIGTRERPFIAMEYVDGAQDVVSYANGHNLSLPQRLDLFLTLAEAIQYGHEQGVLHRDIKPSNLLVSKEGMAKVIDYGIARAEFSEDLEHTMTGEVFGTLGYLAPERLLGKSSADTRSEVYAMGVVLFQLLTGSMPVDLKGRSLAKAVDRLEGREPQRASKVKPGIPEGLDWVCAKALAIDKARRYGSVSDLVSDLKRFLRGQGVHAGAPSRSYLVRSWLRRNRVVASVVALVVLGTIATTIGTSIGLKRAAHQARLHDRALGVLESTLREANQLSGGVDARLSSVLKKIDEQIETEALGDPSVETRMDALLASAYYGSGEIELARKVVQRAKRRGVGRDEDLYNIKVIEAGIHMRVRKTEAAGALYQEVLDHYPDPTIQSGQTLHTQALVGLLRVDAALGGTGRRMDLTNRILLLLDRPDWHCSRSSALVACADSLRVAGDSERAETVIEKLLALSESNANPFLRIKALAMQARLQKTQNRSRQSAATLREAYRLALEFLGDEHPFTMKLARRRIAIISQEGQHSKALAAILQLHQMPGYLNLPVSERIQANIYQVDALTMLRRGDHAVAIADALLEQAKLALDPTDLIILQCEGALAMAMVRNGQFDEGLILLQELAKKTAQRYGPLSITTLNREQDLLAGLLDAKRPAEAAKLARKEIHEMAGTYGPNHVFYWFARQCLTEALTDQSKLDEAQTALDELRATMDLSNSAGNTRRVKSMQRKIDRLRAE